MKIALFGYGKMGKEIESYALSRGHEIPIKVTSSFPKESADFSQIDLIIEFSKPNCAVENIKFAFDLGIPIVVGTTGWYNQLDEIKSACNQKKGCLIYGTNFSIGVNAFFALNQYLAKIMRDVEGYNVSILETHHTEKLDAPSGTGISLAEQILAANGRYTQWKNLPSSELENDYELSLASLRLANVPGTHEVTYSSVVDDIEIKHTAHSRKGFAQGSVLAAEWLQGKSGIFTVQDFLKF
jgi:4-hydroxy-tetrahydrodipicolinate reductase